MVVFGDGVRIQKRYLILESIFPSGGNNLYDGRSISIVTGLSDEMGTCTTTVPPILFVWRGAGASWKGRGRGPLTWEVFNLDWDKFPYPTRFWLAAIILQLDLVQRGASVMVHL